MRRYEAYKDSGFEWVGEIPSSWITLRNKYFLLPTDEKSKSGNEELLSVSEYSGVVPRRSIREEGELSRADSLVGYKIVKEGQLVSNIMLTWKRAIAVSSYTGIVSPAYSVFSFMHGHPRYFHFLFRTDLYVGEFRRNSRGVIDSRLRLYDDEFGVIPAIFPSIAEQHQIVAYLDAKTAQIDRLVALKEQKIALLKEYRTSLISNTLTKGLNPSVSMKESGLEWIGMIPKDWELKKLGYVSHLLTGHPWKSDLFSFDSGLKIVRGENVSEGFFRWGSRTRYWVEPVPFDSVFYLEAGDIVIGMDGSKVGKNYVRVTEGDLPLLLHQRMCRVRINNDLDSSFIEYWIGSVMFRYYIDLSKTDPMIPHITQKNISDFYIPFPSHNEQKQIVKYLDEKIAKIDSTIQTEERKIELLKEYRQSLISAVVIGKIDVRTEVPVA